jgi:two-component system response regulator YesN
MASSGTILIVDDDPSVLEAVGAALAPPYEVLTARSAARALEIAEEQALNLALLDYLLPDASGLSLLRAIQRISPRLPIILMTGFGSEEVAVQSFRSGVRDYLKKPFSFLDLVTRVERSLAISSGPEQTGLRAGRQADAGRLPEADRLPSRSLQRAMAFVEKHLNSSVSLDQVAREAGMSKFHFCRVFKGATDLTFREYLARRRIARAVELLQDRDRSLSEICLSVGFKDMSHFSRVFRKLVGQPPSRFRRVARHLGWEKGLQQETEPGAEGKGRRGEQEQSSH